MKNKNIVYGENIAAFLNLNPNELRTAILYEGLPVLECAGQLYTCTDALSRWPNGFASPMDIEHDPSREAYLVAVIDKAFTARGGEAA